MSIAPIPPAGFGLAPGFGATPAYGVAAGVPHTSTDDLLTGAATAANALGGIAPLSAAGAVAGTTGAGAGAGADVMGSFGQILASKIGALDGLQKTSDALATKAVTGDLQDIHEYTIAANEANVATQLTVAVRNKAVEAFNEIMRMQM